MTRAGIEGRVGVDLEPIARGENGDLGRQRTGRFEHRIQRLPLEFLPQLGGRALVRQADNAVAIHDVCITPGLVQYAATTSPTTITTNPATVSHAMRRPRQPRKTRAPNRAR